MSKLSKVLRETVNNGLTFMCPGCMGEHHIRVGFGDGPRWAWNGDVEKPTFSPSILVTWSEPSDNPGEFDDLSKDVKQICHSFVIDGNIQFLSDCTHDLACKTVPLGIFTY